MSDYNGSLVNLSIPKEVTQPIVAAKIQEAVLAALGGADKIVESIIHKICNTQVNPNDGKVSSYSHDNKITWIDYHVTKIIEEGVKMELKKQIDEGALPIKDALIKVMQSKQGSSKIADALLQGLTDNFNGKNLIPTVKIEFTKPRDNSNW
jgi:hypothetical protein